MTGLIVKDDRAAYTDPEVHRAALALQDEWHFSLPALDNWIEQRCQPERKEQMLDFRRMAIGAVLAGNSAAVLPWLLYFTTAIDFDIHDMAMLPHAVKGVAHGERMAALTSMAAAVHRNYTDDDRDAWRALRKGEFAAHTERRAAQLIAKKLGLNSETVRAALKRKMGTSL